MQLKCGNALLRLVHYFGYELKKKYHRFSITFGKSGQFNACLEVRWSFFAIDNQGQGTFHAYHIKCNELKDLKRKTKSFRGIIDITALGKVTCSLICRLTWEKLGSAMATVSPIMTPFPGAKLYRLTARHLESLSVKQNVLERRKKRSHVKQGNL